MTCGFGDRLSASVGTMPRKALVPEYHGPPRPVVHWRTMERTPSAPTTPKDLVWKQDKVSLYRFRPHTESRVRTPALITYGLVGRWTVTALQEDRSLVRNLLNLGVGPYVVDWGNPSRADRYLTLADNICGYLNACVAEIARRAGLDRINLLGVCAGGGVHHLLRGAGA